MLFGYKPRILLDPNSGEGGGAAGGGTETPPANQTPETVSKKAYEEVRADMLQYKTKLAEVTQQVNQFKTAQETKEREQLESQKQYEALYAKEKTAREEAEKKAAKLINSYAIDQRNRLLESEARKAGIREDAIQDMTRLVDTTVVRHEVVEDATGIKVSVTGIPEFIEAAKTARPFWFAQGGQVKVADVTASPGAAAQGGVPKFGTLTGQQLYELEKKDPEAAREYRRQLYKGVKAPN